MPVLTLSTNAVQFLLRNRLRKSFIVQNEDGAINVFIKRERVGALTVTSSDHDHLLAAGGSISLTTDIDGVEAVQDRWTVIAASGTPLISFFETEDVVR